MMSECEQSSLLISGNEDDSEADMTTSSASNSSIESKLLMLVTYRFEPSATDSESSSENPDDANRLLNTSR